MIALCVRLGWVWMSCSSSVPFSLPWFGRLLLGDSCGHALVLGLIFLYGKRSTNKKHETKQTDHEMKTKNTYRLH
jgi:hypothetical protein